MFFLIFWFFWRSPVPVSPGLPEVHPTIDQNKRPGEKKSGWLKSLAGLTRKKASTRRVNRKIADSTRNQRVFFSRCLAANYDSLLRQEADVFNPVVQEISSLLYSCFHTVLCLLFVLWFLQPRKKYIVHLLYLFSFLTLVCICCLWWCCLGTVFAFAFNFSTLSPVKKRLLKLQKWHFISFKFFFFFFSHPALSFLTLLCLCCCCCLGTAFAVAFNCSTLSSVKKKRSRWT